MDLAVNIICRNAQEDRVIPRFSRYLANNLGWIVTARPDPSAEAYYLSGYFEETYLRPWPRKPVAAYFTHRETQPPGNGKAKLFDRLAAKVNLRIATAAMYADMLTDYGPTAQINPPVERERFTIPAKKAKGRLVAGFSGYTYANKRKGENLAKMLIGSKVGRSVEWRASGRGWPVMTRRYPWSAMPSFYQSLDVYVATGTVEGVPMPPLECLACGVSVVVPLHVGLLDELPEVLGIHRYKAGDVSSMITALAEALEMRSQVDRQALRDATERYTVRNWCEQHRLAFEGIYPNKERILNQTLTAEDDVILSWVRDVYPNVGAVLAWTGRHIPYIKRQIAPYQGAILAYFAHHQNRQGAHFLEIGTALGYSACLMATAAPLAQITTLNPKDNEFEKARDSLKIRSTVRVVKSTSQDFWMARDGELYNLIFVDGDHSYNMVLHDSQFFNCLYTGGLILFHDYSPNGSARPSDGSFQALNDLQTRHRQADIKIIGSGQIGMLGWVRREGEVWA
ncbi:MAG: hypothetical protein A2W25_05145 [candidate division Zixibacteria bacterium RBG_16_53_22]|nr:MAG: hypothetical protein A2W25_05145 [candidate division Zixibacteria bacterium RBG_16_53_22]